MVSMWNTWPLELISDDKAMFAPAFSDCLQTIVLCIGRWNKIALVMSVGPRSLSVCTMACLKRIIAFQPYDDLTFGNGYMAQFLCLLPILILCGSLFRRVRKIPKVSFAMSFRLSVFQHGTTLLALDGL